MSARRSSGVVLMPFGAHKGTLLSKVPDDYLEWLLSIELREPLLSAVRTEAAVRENAGYARKHEEACAAGKPMHAPEVSKVCVACKARKSASPQEEEPDLPPPAEEVWDSEPTEPEPPQVPPGDTELKAAVLDLRDAVVVLTRVTSDLGLAMTRMSNTLDRIERQHFEAKPGGGHWTDAVPPTEAGAQLEDGEPF
jgi:hypothetical protein